MKKKEYIQKLSSLIVNRVNCHAPKVLSGDIDFALLDAIGIDPSFPIFVFDKPLDKIFFQAFLEAKKQVDFNLILTQNPIISKKKIDLLNQTFIFNKNEIGGNLLNTFQQLNINSIFLFSTFKYSSFLSFLKSL